MRFFIAICFIIFAYITGVRGTLLVLRNHVTGSAIIQREDRRGWGARDQAGLCVAHPELRGQDNLWYVSQESLIGEDGQTFYGDIEDGYEVDA